jgi:hypothetical protein
LKILLDESVPHIVKSRLSPLAIRTVQDMGWAGIKNGELLKRANEQFDVFITADKKLRYQQNLSGLKLAVIVIPTNQVLTVVALIPAIEEALGRVQTVRFIEIALPT